MHNTIKMRKREGVRLLRQNATNEDCRNSRNNRAGIRAANHDGYQAAGKHGSGGEGRARILHAKVAGSGWDLDDRDRRVIFRLAFKHPEPEAAGGALERLRNVQRIVENYGAGCGRIHCEAFGDAQRRAIRRAALWVVWQDWGNIGNSGAHAGVAGGGIGSGNGRREGERGRYSEGN